MGTLVFYYQVLFLLFKFRINSIMYLNVFSYLVNRMHGRVPQIFWPQQIVRGLQPLYFMPSSILSLNPWPSKLPKKDNNWAQVVQVRVKLSLHKWYSSKSNLSKIKDPRIGLCNMVCILSQSGLGFETNVALFFSFYCKKIIFMD